MPKLRNARTGVTVSVSDATASRLSAEWGPADEPAEVGPPKPRRGRPPKTAT